MDIKEIAREGDILPYPAEEEPVDEKEFLTMKQCSELLSGLTPPQADRVTQYLRDRFGFDVRHPYMVGRR